MIRRHLLLIFLSAICLESMAQNLDSLSSRALAASVVLDSVVISATREGFDVEDFIEMVRNDESLHDAFQNLREVNCTFETRMRFTDKKDRESAALDGQYIQAWNGTCRKLTRQDEQISGDYFKGRKRKLRYYTAKLYQRVFVTKGEVCSTNETKPNDPDDKTEGHIEELKKLIFSPGSKADVPLIGKKTELFSPQMAPFYDFFIRADTLNGLAAYRFEARVKEEYQDNPRKTVIKELSTWFGRQDLQVLARTYTLSHNTALYMFDVTMEVRLDRIDELYYPVFVSYQGTWNIPTKKRETGTFEINFQDHTLNE